MHTLSSTPPPTPVLLANDINLTPLLNVKFEPKADTFEESINLELLKNSPFVSFPPAFQTIPKNDLYYQYIVTDTSGLVTNIDISVFFQDSNIVYPSTYCNQNNYFSEFSKENNFSYCISYLTQGRGGPDSFYQLYDYYVGFVHIQKEFLDITISEWTQNTDRQAINDAIEQLAKIME
jgi:hypothetical protein